MKLTDAINLITEGEKKAPREKKGAHKKAFKGRVRTYDSIKTALSDGKYGDIFTTKAADRLYVISKGKWGAKSGRGKIAKGFTRGSATPSADFGSVRKHAARTMLRYGKASDKLAQKYGSRSIKKERGLKQS